MFIVQRHKSTRRDYRKLVNFYIVFLLINLWIYFSQAYGISASINVESLSPERDFKLLILNFKYILNI